VASEVLICSTIGAAPRKRRRRATSRTVEREPDAQPLPVTRLTVVITEDLGAPADAAAWLERVATDPEAVERLVADALLVVNRALHAQRAATQDPYTHEVSSAQATATRIGYGEGEQVAEGLWSDARELVRGEPRRRRAESLRPQERVAGVLGGRERVEVCETLVVRARLDLDQRRVREAALQLGSGIEALLAELTPGAGPRQADDIAALEARRSAMHRAAESAVRGDLDAGREEELRETLEIAERILRRRRLLSE
jgi:hypothetical protein